MMEFFCKKYLTAFICCFGKKLHLRCLTGFWKRLWIHTLLLNSLEFFIELLLMQSNKDQHWAVQRILSSKKKNRLALNIYSKLSNILESVPWCWRNNVKSLKSLQPQPTHKCIVKILVHKNNFHKNWSNNFHKSRSPKARNFCRLTAGFGG